MEAHSQELKEDYARLVARVAELDAVLRWHMGIGERDEWECEHGQQVSKPCFSDCHLNRTRRVLGYIP